MISHGIPIKVHTYTMTYQLKCDLGQEIIGFAKENIQLCFKCLEQLKCHSEKEGKE